MKKKNVSVLVNITWIAFGLSFATLVTVTAVVIGVKYYRQRRFEEQLLASSWTIDLSQLQNARLGDSFKVRTYKIASMTESGCYYVSINRPIV